MACLDKVTETSEKRDTSISPDLLDLSALKKYKDICEKVNAQQTKMLILVNIQKEVLHFKNGPNVHSYQISSAKNGIGQEDGSGKTPLGLHIIQERIGEGADPLEIFESRKPTGQLAKENDPEKSCIVGRILRLKGLEEGFNLGKNEYENSVDTYSRYIYIHGTNRIQETRTSCLWGMYPDET